MRVGLIQIIEEARWLLGTTASALCNSALLNMVDVEEYDSGAGVHDHISVGNPRQSHLPGSSSGRGAAQQVPASAAGSVSLAWSASGGWAGARARPRVRARPAPAGPRPTRRRQAAGLIVPAARRAALGAPQWTTDSTSCMSRAAVSGSSMPWPAEAGPSESPVDRLQLRPLRAERRELLRLDLGRQVEGRDVVRGTGEGRHVDQRQRVQSRRRVVAAPRLQLRRRPPGSAAPTG